MYPYLDFFNDPEPREMDFMNDPVLDDKDLRSHLNARVGSDRAHPEEPPPEDPVNIIHEAPTVPPGAGPMPYQYPVHPMGIPDLNYQWWQHTPQSYAPPPTYQYQPVVYPIPAYFPTPGVSAVPPGHGFTPVNPEFRRVQSERRPPSAYQEPLLQPPRSGGGGGARISQWVGV
nr:uncharacterized protein LOC109155647 [Ipomoea trifida]